MREHHHEHTECHCGHHHEHAECHCGHQHEYENFLMGIAAVAAFILGDYAEAVAILLFSQIGKWFENFAVKKSRHQIMNAVDMRAEQVHLVSEQGIRAIPAKEAKIGDVVVVRVGDRIPLDAIVVEGVSQIDTAPITGEATPVDVMPGDAVVSGCINKSGVLNIRVEKTLEESMVTRILHSVEHAASSKPKVDRFITRFAKVYTPIVVALAVVVAVIPSLITGEWNKWIYTAVTFLVVSCPCALVLSVPLTFFAGIGAGSKKKILFKGGVVIEALEQIKAVVMDKTGTLTKGTFEVQKIVTYYDYGEDEVLQIAAECEMQSTHPIANYLVQKAKGEGIYLQQPKATEEIAGRGVRAITSKGDALCGNRAFLEENGIVLPPYEAIEYGTEVFVACQGRLVGHIVVSDSLKADSKEVIDKLKKRGIPTIMLTGDSQQSADAIAVQAGIEEVYAMLLPDEKLECMQKLRKQYGNILYVGDGINDAPVLAGADVGAAMGHGADAAIEAADVVFMTTSMHAILESMEIAKKTRHRAAQNIILALAAKALVLIMGLFGLANMWMAVLADSGVALLCVLNAIRILKRK